MQELEKESADAHAMTEIDSYTKVEDFAGHIVAYTTTISDLVQKYSYPLANNPLYYAYVANRDIWANEPGFELNRLTNKSFGPACVLSDSCLKKGSLTMRKACAEEVAKIVHVVTNGFAEFEYLPLDAEKKLFPTLKHRSNKKNK